MINAEYNCKIIATYEILHEYMPNDVVTGGLVLEVTDIVKNFVGLNRNPKHNKQTNICGIRNVLYMTRRLIVVKEKA